MFAPVITLVFFFLQPGGILIDAADPANASDTIAAMVGNAGLGKVVSVLIALGLLVFLYGILTLQENISRSNGNGVALSRLASLFILVGVIGWVLTAAIALRITGSDLPADQAVALFESLYLANLGIGAISGVIAGIGFLALALAVSTREGSNKIAALVAAAAAVVVIVVTLVGAMDTSQLEAMNQITGITYLVHMVWFFILGSNLIKAD